MGLTFQISNSIQSLSENLTDHLKNSKRSLFTPDVIVAQTEGMHIWLKEQIAQKNGIASNLKFLQPNNVILLVYKLLGGKFKKDLSRDNLIWILFQLLKENKFSIQYPDQANYIGKSPTDEHYKRIGLATKVADLFDQYQIYRPKIIEAWNQPFDGDYIMDWQEYLWRRAKVLTQSKVPDKTEITRFIKEKLEENDEQTIQNLKDNLPDIYLFGLSIITKFHIEIFEKLSEKIGIHYFLVNPAPEYYWTEDKNEKAVSKWKLQHNKLNTEDIYLIGNDLLTSWGKVTSTTLRLLYQNDMIFNIEDVTAIEPNTDTLLHAVQNDIYHNQIIFPAKYDPNYFQDQSLTIHAHYTIAREVEGLYQYLIHIIQNTRKPIHAREIAIFVTDIDAYAPYIQAIFENGPIKFRFKIADTEVVAGDSIFNTLQKILELNTINFTSENVLQIIESKYVIKMFGFTDLDKIRAAVKAANIRFGIQGNKEDETYLVSWLYGLKRMMYGICMSGETLYQDVFNENFYPIDLIEGYDSQNLISFIYFIDLLIKNIQSRKYARNLITWNAFVLETVHNFIYFPGEEMDEDYQLLEKKNKELNEEDTIYTEEINFEIFAYNFIETLQHTRRNALFLKDGITFCSLIPMRSIPFKIIGMLGMDGDHFPRKEQNLSFNKMLYPRELGDRDVKENDKNLFLETLMSAQSNLYISYIGKSIKDNKDINPSVLIDELINYLQKRAPKEIKVKAQIVYQHPLYANSEKYNRKNDNGLYFYNYRLANLEGLASSLKINDAPINHQNVEEDKELQMIDLVRFFQDAPKTYYNKVLGIYYNEAIDVLPEEEIFHLDKLQTIQIEDTILQSGKEKEILVNELKLKGVLPLKNPGLLTFQSIEQELQPLLLKFNTLTKNESNIKNEFSFKLLNYNIKCNLINIFNDELIIISKSNKAIDEKNLIYAYILNLITLYNELNISINIIGKNIFLKSIKKHISKEEAKKRLENLLHLFKKGEERLLPYSTTLILKGKQYIELVEKNNGKNLIRMISKDTHSYASQYLEMAYKDGLENNPTLDEDWKEYHDQLIIPMQEAFEEINEPQDM
ncbi:exodeoxyribonuclease V subunit gamma [Rhizosphaericola mali]|uniref:RecBCD enzyme subunit RecC n=1 Tax=Rhizosphaericola mali TaxID=2545455 RepID=A0A5P2FYB8_9BACT|nr:exodeoxyribonuclease V subunit gamma [Rhizosphaericola mali]QES88175.1 exonuclease V subunit gamma [Rhizosphaericola mali]